jgi:hypothetical protein
MIRNTHYNLIDTLIFAFGWERWNNICKMVMPAVRERLGEDSILIPLNGRYFQFGKVPNNLMVYILDEIISIMKVNTPDNEVLQFPAQIRYTILECVLWAMTDGYIIDGGFYGLPKEETV